MATPLTEHEQIAEKISTLQTALLSQHPTMPSLLRDIHQKLKQDPALVTILSDEQIAIIVSGLKAQTNTVIASTIKKPSTTAALKKLTADDLGF